MKSCSLVDGYKFPWQPGLHYCASAAKTAVIREGAKTCFLATFRSFSSAGGKRKPKHVRTRVTHSVRAAAKQLQQLLTISDGFISSGGWRKRRRKDFGAPLVIFLTTVWGYSQCIWTYINYYNTTYASTVFTWVIQRKNLSGLKIIFYS